MMRLKAADIAVVNDNTNLHRFADLFDMGGDTILRGFGKVVGKKQDAAGAEAFGFLGKLNRYTRWSAGPGNNGHVATTGIHGGLDDCGILFRFEREEFAR